MPASNRNAGATDAALEPGPADLILRPNGLGDVGGAASPSEARGLRCRQFVRRLLPIPFFSSHPMCRARVPPGGKSNLLWWTARFQTHYVNTRRHRPRRNLIHRDRHDHGSRSPAPLQSGPPKRTEALHVSYLPAPPFEMLYFPTMPKLVGGNVGPKPHALGRPVGKASLRTRGVYCVSAAAIP